MNTRQVVEALEHFQWDGGDWLGLDELVDELWKSGAPRQGLQALLGVFERYPDSTGYGVFWSILHGIESLGDYEPVLISSMRRAPSLFGVMMVGRILNTRLEPERRAELRSLLEAVVLNEQAPGVVREEASSWLKSTSEP
ncbi:hypothetical protein HPC49_10125 [Pyxidicoccus fallax]|uniref:Immunity protein 30 domain-containing protein n=1 Tax=Pyxidicoccus fallax TaxID=394095 RepID=A0A848LK67_9BACT|nr:hypothetical protein [Pyxidicoccus fallax]NMO18092.1 hypothetical protein [Pyxidicoccus fallax]NPC78598.1 hypothetical protein [Pyxidicoccus fallax]